MSIGAAIVALLSLLARLAPHVPTFIRWGDQLFAVWAEARERENEAARQRSLAAIDARRANERAQIEADMLAAEKERQRRAAQRVTEFMEYADAEAKKQIEAARARSELADRPSAPKP